jgi:hypothetical protein
MIHFLFISFVAFALENNSVDPLHADLIKQVDTHVKEIIDAKSTHLKWQKFENLRQNISEFENKNDEKISIATRIDISALLVMYIPILPAEVDFKKSDCPNYYARLLSEAHVDSTSDLSPLEQKIYAIIDAICKN